MSDLLKLATSNARTEFPVRPRIVFDVDPVTYAGQRIHECTADLLDAVIATEDIALCLRVRDAVARALPELDAVCQTALRKAVKLTQQGAK